MRVASPVVSGGPWTSVCIAILESKIERTYSGRQFGSYTQTIVQPMVVLQPGNVRAPLTQIAEAYRLRFAGHGIAWSAVGTPWRWVALDTTPPLSCQHIEVAGSGPPTRDLVRAILADPERHRGDDWKAVAAFAKDDGDLQLGLVRAAIRPRSGLSLEEIPIVADPRARDECVRYLREPGIRGRVSACNAAALVERYADEEVQDALATALLRWADPLDHRADAIEGNYERIVIRSLARVTETRRAAPGRVADILERRLLETKGDGVPRLYAIRALAAIGRREPIERLAGPDGRAWPADFDAFVAEIAGKASDPATVASWARSALTSTPGPSPA